MDTTNVRTRKENKLKTYRDSKKKEGCNNFIIKLKWIVLCFIGAIAVSVLVCYGLMHLSHWYANNHFEKQTLKKIENVREEPKPDRESSEENLPALFGDSFGSVNAVISALAFLGVFIALFMQQRQIQLQREDLKLQRKELKNNTKELRLQRLEFEEQNKNIRLQRFENTFFQMLNLHHEIVLGLKIRARLIDRDGNITEEKELVGREIFSLLYNNVYYNIIENNENKIVGDSKGVLEIITKHGIDGYSQTTQLSVFDHYFRNLYRIFKFIASTPEVVLTEDEKKDYAAIVRASLSEYELVFLFFNCIYMEQIIKEPMFRGFAERFHLLNNIRKEKIGEDLFNKYSDNFAYSAYNW